MLKNESYCSGIKLKCFEMSNNLAKEKKLIKLLKIITRWNFKTPFCVKRIALS